MPFGVVVWWRGIMCEHTMMLRKLLKSLKNIEKSLEKMNESARK